MTTLIADRGTGEPISLGAALIAGKKVPPDVTELLTEDHRVVLGMFRWYEQSTDPATRTVLVRRICALLRAHMEAEEKWVYPAARDVQQGDDLVTEAYEEHGEAKSLMNKLDKVSDPKKQETLMMELRDDIVAHVGEEEQELFPAMRESDLDLYELGRAAAAERLQALLQALGKNRPEKKAKKVQEYPKMQIAQDEARELFIAGLKNAHATARNGAKMLQAQVKRLEHYPKLKAKLETSLEQKKSQLTRLENLLESHGESRSAFKDTVMSAGAGLSQLASAGADDEVVKNSFAMLAHAKFEAAAYETLILFGEACGETPTRLQPLQLSLSEERGLATFIEENLRPTGMRFLQLRSEGRQASH